MRKNEFTGVKALIMGLGLNGGGEASARYLYKNGAEVTVTDLRDEEALSSSLENLKDLPIRYVLGRHEMQDFLEADLVIKNPGVRLGSPFLKASKNIETDISLFLAALKNRGVKPRISAVTGTKGKTCTSTALHRALDGAGRAFLGGNIRVSPLSFLDEIRDGDDIVLELSSWQLGDLRGRNDLKPRVVIMTPIMRDHLNTYAGMEEYIADKRLIYANQDKGDVIIAEDDEWGMSFFKESRGRPLVYSKMPLKNGVQGGRVLEKGPCIAQIGEKTVEIVPEELFVKGFHQKQNLLAAGLALLDLGFDAGFIKESLGSFPGVEHRLEFFHESRGVRFYNDSTATIPEAAIAAISAFERPPILVAGGTDKDLDFRPLAEAAGKVKAFILLEGSGSNKLKALLDGSGQKYKGPYDSIEKAALFALEEAEPGDTVVLSPGCTSFGMFLNEFRRGDKWKEAVRNLTDKGGE
ncbi:MAG: UDP-N-acetylmuramoyl-L-alanine--D-glutamate ligase [Treponema sp.]|nr:UDP-N-acetylmuramoyl-L-alanine--D-glutamate ligase [Treponema sp.]